MKAIRVEGAIDYSMDSESKYPKEYWGNFVISATNDSAFFAEEGTDYWAGPIGSLAVSIYENLTSWDTLSSDYVEGQLNNTIPVSTLIRLKGAKFTYEEIIEMSKAGII